MMPDDAPEPSRTLIGVRTATVLYLLLVVFACVTLKGNALALALIIIGGLAVKSLLHYFRERSQP